MKLKPYKEKTPVLKMVKEIYSNVDTSSPTAITIDTDGGIVIENLKKIIDYQHNKLVVETNTKTVYIYGENLTIASCDKHFAAMYGNIEKIEIFSKEV